ncbi:MAG: transcriptional regulator with XRE-family HTH domain [Rhodothermales bacterium]|jgi:transcriptional regulator with XRE-family HTH domain
MTTSAEQVSKQLRSARQKAGLSLRQLAERAGTSHATLLVYEQGKKVPGTLTFFRILEACGFEVDVRITPRIRQQDGIGRGDELVAVLKLAEQFPHRASRHLEMPRFAECG